MAPLTPGMVIIESKTCPQRALPLFDAERITIDENLLVLSISSPPVAVGYDLVSVMFHHPWIQLCGFVWYL
jgi:hypothetical protein